MSQLFVIELKGPSGQAQYFLRSVGRRANEWAHSPLDAKHYSRKATAVAKRARLYNGIPRNYALEVVPLNV